MASPDRTYLKARAKERVLDQSFGILTVSFLYLLLTDWLSEFANLFFTNPLNSISTQFTTSMNNLMNTITESGGTAPVDLAPIYSSTFDFARNLLAQPGQQFILFFFLLFYFYSIVLSYGFSGFAMSSARGERKTGSALFDQLWLAGKIILLSLLTSLIVGLWSVFFILPGIYFFYGYLLAPYVLLDHPEMPVLQVLKTSSQLSRGHKLQLLTLDLSFIGWMLLCYIAATLGLNIGTLLNSPILSSVLSTLAYTVVYVFVMPYRELSLVNFYDAIRTPDLKVE